MSRPWLIGCMVVLGTISLSARPACAAYTFTNVADTAGQFFSFSPPSINSEGTVAFRAELDTFHSGIYVSVGQAVTPVAHNNATSFQGFVFQTPGIDAEGQVYFAASRTGGGGGGNGIFYGSGGSVSTYALNTSPVGITSFGKPAISESGQVAFRASHVEVPAGPGRTGVFHGPEVLESSSGAFLDFGNGNAEIDVNDGGTVVFTGTLDSEVSGVYIDSVAGGPAIPIADSSGQFSNFVHSSPSINNDGMVAFHASLDVGGDGIFVGSADMPATPLVTSGGSFTSFAPVASINASGQVAYTASTIAGNGLFLGPDFINDRILLAGDALFGSTVTAVVISNTSLNDAGQVAFRYSLANGVNGLAIASPMDELLPGDFDLDGDVDGRDFLFWQRNPSVGDLADWQNNYGAGSLVAESVAVPEPASLSLICVMAAMIPARLRCAAKHVTV